MYMSLYLFFIEGIQEDLGDVGEGLTAKMVIQIPKYSISLNRVHTLNRMRSKYVIEIQCKMMNNT